MSKTARAAAALAKYSALWCSRLSKKTKLRYLRSQVLSILLYGCEPGNHMEGDLKIMARFLRRCMVKLASRRKPSRMRGTVLMRPLDLMSRPRVSFIAQLLVDPPSELARRMTFAVVANPIRPRDRRIAARDRAAYWNVLSRDMRFLSTDSPVSHTLEDVQEVYRAGRKARVARFLKRLKPSTDLASYAVPKPREIRCSVRGCGQRVVTVKEMTRHLRLAHPAQAGKLLPKLGARQAAQRQQPQLAYSCPHQNCVRSYRTLGWLNRHVKQCHRNA